MTSAFRNTFQRAWPFLNLIIVITANNRHSALFLCEWANWSQFIQKETPTPHLANLKKTAERTGNPVAESPHHWLFQSLPPTSYTKSSQNKLQKKFCTEQIQTPCLVTHTFGETGISNPHIYKWRAKQISNFLLVHEAERLRTPKQITQVFLAALWDGSTQTQHLPEVQGRI